MKRVLYVAYYFPPDGGAGTQRSLKFCKYLPEFGWKPTVLTREGNREREVWDPEDRSFLDELPAEVSVVRVATEKKGGGGVSGWNDIPKSYLRAFYVGASSLLRQQDYDVILITMSPFFLGQLGIQLNAEFGVPVVYDLRDPWALDGWRAYRTKLHWHVDINLMRRTLSSAAGVIANTCDAAIALANHFKDIDICPKMTVIPNGYDGEDFVTTGGACTKSSSNSDFIVVHAGTLHTGFLYRRRTILGILTSLLRFRPEPIVPSGRTEYFLYGAIRLLQEKKHPLVKSIRFVCVGQNSQANLRCAKEAGLQDRVHFTGYLPHQQSLEWLFRADVLFLPLHDLPPGSRSLIVPGKTYEYLAARRPILAALPPGDARDLIEMSAFGFIASPRSPAEIAAALCRIYDLREVPRSACEVPKWLEAFERRELTRKLADFLFEVTKTSIESNDFIRRNPAQKPEEETSSERDH